MHPLEWHSFFNVFIDRIIKKSTNKKTLFPVENKVFLTFGGDKRDRTADLLNAMCSSGGQNESHWINWSK